MRTRIETRFSGSADRLRGLTTFAATRESLLGVDAPAGRDLITLNSGTPYRAREFARFAHLSWHAPMHELLERAVTAGHGRTASPR
ncbi:hypothetical protein ACFVJ5_13465 [Nocardia sp. NPDC127606]|uniref:hypothetical protein n=1 Tax=Nocardia sp. NPDC127606 TaxID=3345406 RepID=UPI003642F23D